MADQNEESADSMLLKAAESPWSIPTIVNPAVRGEILLHMFKKWRSRSSREKLAILFIIFCIKKSTITALEKEITEIILAGSDDLDEWVRLVSKMMLDYPKTGVLDLAVEKYLPVDIKDGLKQLIDSIGNKEIKFHPVEYAFMDKDICDSFSMVSKNSESERFKSHPPPSPYFTLRQDYVTSREQRLSLLNNLPTVPMSPGLISPIGSTGFNFNIDSNRAYASQNISQNAMANRQTPSQNPSLTRRLSQPYPRSNSLPPGPINTSFKASSNGYSGIDSPTELKITQGKKYQKETRIQILDITTGSSIIRNQEETKLKTHLEEVQLKEQRKLEREKKQEERRREEVEKKQTKEKEKAEKLRQREEARLAKEKEKQERATAKAGAITTTTAAEAAATTAVATTATTTTTTITPAIAPATAPAIAPATTAIAPATTAIAPTTTATTTVRTETPFITADTAPETTKRQGSNYRKRKKLSDETEDTSMEEIVTEGENAHKDTQIIFNSPKSPLSPLNTSYDSQIQQPSSTPLPLINENEDTRVMQDILEVNNNSQNIDLSDSNIRLPQRILEILDKKTKEERQQILEHIYEVLEKANLLSEQDRELIIYFLADLHNEVKSQLMDISDGLTGPNDERRRLDLNVERITRYDEGKEIHETFIFEMNLADGTWRKLKKTKTKLVKNANL